MAAAYKKISAVSKLEKRLARLKLDFSLAGKLETRAKLIFQIRLAEEDIKKEKMHKISGLNKIRYCEVLSGAPGLGKRK